MCTRAREQSVARPQPLRRPTGTAQATADEWTARGTELEAEAETETVPLLRGQYEALVGICSAEAAVSRCPLSRLLCSAQQSWTYQRCWRNDARGGDCSGRAQRSRAAQKRTAPTAEKRTQGSCDVLFPIRVGLECGDGGLGWDCTIGRQCVVRSQSAPPTSQQCQPTCLNDAGHVTAAIAQHSIVTAADGRADVPWTSLQPDQPPLPALSCHGACVTLRCTHPNHAAVTAHCMPTLALALCQSQPAAICCAR